MSWKIEIPFYDHDREHPLDVAALDELPRAIADPEERHVTRHLMFKALIDGHCKTVADLVSAVENASPEQRREWLDEAREAAGLPDTKTADARAQFDATQRAIAAVPHRDDKGRMLMSCADPTCDTLPLNHAGFPTPTKANKWWCSQHVHLAAPGDMDDWTLRVRYAKGGGIEFPDQLEAEARRAESEQESNRAKAKARDEERAVEVDGHRRYQAALEEHFRPSIGGWR